MRVSGNRECSEGKLARGSGSSHPRRFRRERPRCTFLPPALIPAFPSRCSMLHAVGLLLVLQQPSTVPQAPSPIAKAIVRPSEVAIQVGDTVRLTVSAQDSAGRPFSNTSARWFQAGGRFEGTVDSTGLVTGGATGTLTVTALVSPTGGGSPATAFARVTI